MNPLINFARKVLLTRRIDFCFIIQSLQYFLPDVQERITNYSQHIICCITFRLLWRKPSSKKQKKNYACNIISFFESVFFDVLRVVYRIQILNINCVENEGKISKFFHPNSTQQETMIRKPSKNGISYINSSHIKASFSGFMLCIGL